MNLRLGVAALALFTLSLPAFAQAPAPAPEGINMRIRATIDTIEDNILTVTTVQGEQLTMTLNDDVRVSGATARTLADIGPGTFIASAGERRADGRVYAVEVRLFRPGDARQFDWDLGPDSVMTNAPIVEVLAVEDGQLFKVALDEGEAEYVVGPDVPIYEMELADRSILVAGAYGVFNATLWPDGSYTVRSVNAERDGVKPAL